MELPDQLLSKRRPGVPHCPCMIYSRLNISYQYYNNYPYMGKKYRDILTTWHLCTVRHETILC